MPYFRNNNINLLFIHVPKTGGTSLEHYFSKKFNIALSVNSLYGFLSETVKNNNNININSSLQHITYHTINKYKDFLKINMDNLEFITIVRNPYERFVSDLFFLKKINIHTTKETVYEILKKYFTEAIDNHNIPQYLFVTDENKQLLPGLKILHTESLKTDMINLGYTDFNIKENSNAHKNINYYNYLNDQSINIINNYYDDDFKLFGYKKIENITDA